MSKWKLQIRNKIEDSKVEEPVRTLVHTEDERIGALAEQLLGYWSTLELSYRIPRVSKIASVCLSLARWMNQ
jgi:histone-lysine N-methyltransferase SETD2